MPLRVCIADSLTAEAVRLGVCLSVRPCVRRFSHEYPQPFAETEAVRARRVEKVRGALSVERTYCRASGATAALATVDFFFSWPKQSEPSVRQMQLQQTPRPSRARPLLRLMLPAAGCYRRCSERSGNVSSSQRHTRNKRNGFSVSSSLASLEPELGLHMHKAQFNIDDVIAGLRFSAERTGWRPCECTAAWNESMQIIIMKNIYQIRTKRSSRRMCLRKFGCIVSVALEFSIIVLALDFIRSLLPSLCSRAHVKPLLIF